MKLTSYLAIAASVLALAACSNNKNCNSCDKSACDTTACDSSKCDNACNLCDCTPGTALVYTGTIPAADAAGVECTLKLEYMEKDNGVYTLAEKALDQAGTTVDIRGDFKVYKGTTESADKEYIKLTPSHADRASEVKDANDNTRYFLVDNDSTITMVGADLQRAASGLNYTLTLKK